MLNDIFSNQLKNSKIRYTKVIKEESKEIEIDINDNKK